MDRLEFRHGVAHRDGQPAFFISAEYPYFRDAPVNWEPRLQQLKQMGLRVVSTYIPWRHHEVVVDGRRRFDFDGATAAARNVIRFLRLCQQLGLEVLLKPGPFCHAELNYGGLPDFVCPLIRPDVEPRLAADGSAVTWGGSQAGADGRPVPWPLPSPFSAAYRREVKRWFEAVSRQVLQGLCAPQGPIVALQVGNEGIYSDAQHAVWAHDYSAPALDRFRRWLRRRYRSLAAYNAWHNTAVADWRQIEPPRRYTPPGDLRGLQAYADWSEFLGQAMGELYAGYARLLSVPVPALANVNPPVADPWGVDAWLSRVQTAAWGPVHYGYTNWIGVAAEDPSAMARYMLLTRREKGPNVEENWGFTDPYGAPYEHPSVCLQQTLLAIAGGATGYNLYTAVGTSSWDDHLDAFQKRPYPSHSPIAPDGTLTPKAAVASLLGEFFTTYGSEFVECRPVAAAAWGIYLPYSFLGAWTAGVAPEQRRIGARAAPAPGPVLMACQQMLRKQGADLDYLDLQRASPGDLGRHSLLLLAGGPHMDVATQDKLATYAASGGRILLIGEVPQLDEHWQPYRRLAEVPLTRVPDAAAAEGALAGLLASAGGPRLAIEPRDGGHAWIWGHPDRDVHYVVVLSRQVESLRLRYRWRARAYDLALGLAPAGGAVIRVVGEKPDAVFIKGVNEYLQRSVNPACRLNGFEVSAPSTGDLLAFLRNGRWER